MRLGRAAAGASGRYPPCKRSDFIYAMKKENWFSRMFSGPARDEQILSPLTGQVIPIESVADPTFSGKVLGDGVAVIPEEGRLYAPADGTVENLMDTGHALGIVTKGLQAELLIHVGRDTVSLQGQHFTLHVREGDTVKAGQLLMEFDMAAIGELGFDLTTPVIVCNSSDFDLVKCGSKQVALGDVLLTLTRKQN